MTILRQTPAVVALVVCAWALACGPEPTPTPPAEPTPPSSPVSPSTPTKSPASTPTPTASPVPAPTRVPVPTSPPKPINGSIYHWSRLRWNFPCNNIWTPAPDKHDGFLHWAHGDSQLVFDAMVFDAMDPANRGFDYGTFPWDVWAVSIGDAQAVKLADTNRPAYVPAPMAHMRGEDLVMMTDGKRLDNGQYAEVSSNGSRIVYSTCEYPIEYPVEYSVYWYQVNWHDQEQEECYRRRGLCRESGHFVSEGVAYELATMAVDGSDRRRLTTSLAFENYPAWSPDGSQIAFIAGPFAEYPGQEYYSEGHYDRWFSDLMTMNADGSDARVVIGNRKGKALNPGVDLYPPAWSPDGERLAFVGDQILYTVRPDGSELTRIGETDTAADWSPDGEEVAYGRSESEVGVYVARFDGSDRRLVADLPAHDVSWSPDGTELLVAAGDIYLVRRDGSGLRKLDTGIPRGWFSANRAVWSSDGARIAARSEETVVTVARDGADLRVLWSSGPVDYAYCGSVAEEDCAVMTQLRRSLSDHRLYWLWPSYIVIQYWEGVEAGDNVYELSLPGHGLSGRIPPEIVDLTELSILDLSSNRLRGPVPVELGNLSLRKLDLSSNQLSGPIPPEIGNLTGLGELYLSSNRLVGPIPPELGKMTYLWRLDLSSNQLSGPIPPELGRMTNLRRLDLSSNRLNGPIPPELGSLRLDELDLSDNLLTGCIPAEFRQMQLWVEATGLKSCLSEEGP